MRDSNERLLIAIGKVVSSWAALEGEIRVQCLVMEKYEPSGSERPNVILTNLETRFKFLRNFWQRLAKKSYPEKETQINNINMTLVSLSKERDSVVHQTWKIAPNPHDIGTTTIILKDGVFHYDSFLTSWGFLEEMPEKIERVHKEISELQSL